MILTYKYRIYPTKEQEAILGQWCGSVRYLWNHMLDLNKTKYEEEKKFVFAFDMYNLLPELKKELPFLKEVPSQALQHKCLDLDLALKASVGKRRRAAGTEAGFPVFQKKRHGHGSFRISQTGRHIATTETHLKIPKMDPIKWVYHRPHRGRIKTCTIKQDGKHWYACLSCEVPHVAPIPVDSDNAIGIDLGLTTFAVLSSGEKIHKPSHIKKKERQIKKLQRHLARKKKGSNNRKNQIAKLARKHQQVRFARADWLHQTSSELIRNQDIIILEDLKVKGLLKPGLGSWNKKTHDQGWYQFRLFLEYKAKKSGKQLVIIDRFAPSTKTCSHCGHKMPKLPVEVRTWECPTCYLVHDRDENAAENIRAWGLLLVPSELLNTGGTPGINACGDERNGLAYDSPLGSRKQEATGSLDQR